MSLSPFEKILIRKTTCEWKGWVPTQEPDIYQNPILFVSDGSGGLILEHIYIKTPTLGLIDLTGGSISDVSNGANLGTGRQVLSGKTGNILNFRTLTPGANIILTQNTDDIVIEATTAAPTYEVITLSVSTVIDETLDVTEINNDLPGATNSSIINGTVNGQKKILTLTTLTNPGATFNVGGSYVGGSTLVFDEIGQTVELMWTSVGAWVILQTGAILN